MPVNTGSAPRAACTSHEYVNIANSPNSVIIAVA